MDRTLHVTGHDPSAHYKKDTLDAFLYFRADRKMIKVELNDILYAESLKDYIKIFTPLKTIITKQSPLFPAWDAATRRFYKNSQVVFSCLE